MVEISTIFEIISKFPFLRVGLTPGAISDVLYILPVTLGICFEDLMSVSLTVI
jgi:hypothetical protein